jgi:hypothetical protein
MNRTYAVAFAVALAGSLAIGLTGCPGSEVVTQYSRLECTPEGASEPNTWCIHIGVACSGYEAEYFCAWNEDGIPNNEPHDDWDENNSKFVGYCTPCAPDGAKQGSNPSPCQNPTVSPDYPPACMDGGTTTPTESTPTGPGETTVETGTTITTTESPSSTGTTSTVTGHTWCAYPHQPGTLPGSTTTPLCTDDFPDEAALDITFFSECVCVIDENEHNILLQGWNADPGSMWQNSETVLFLKRTYAQRCRVAADSDGCKQYTPEECALMPDSPGGYNWPCHKDNCLELMGLDHDDPALDFTLMPDPDVDYPFIVQPEPFITNDPPYNDANYWGPTLSGNDCTP